MLFWSRRLVLSSYLLLPAFRSAWIAMKTPLYGRHNGRTNDTSSSFYRDYSNVVRFASCFRSTSTLLDMDQQVPTYRYGTHSSTFHALHSPCVRIQGDATCGNVHYDVTRCIVLEEASAGDTIDRYFCECCQAIKWWIRCSN